jgi:hypothetical protein
MASLANVYTTVSNAVMYTDQVRVSTGTTSVSYNVKLRASDGTFPDTIFSADVIIPANSFESVYVGVGNRMTVTGSSFTVEECGTASSGTSGVS